MIQASEVFTIGRFAKPHGMSGELLFLLTDDIFDRTESPYWVLDIDGILVPFFVESYRFRSENSALVKLEGIHNDREARFLADKLVYYPQAFADGLQSENTASGWSFYKGFELRDALSEQKLGLIEAVDESTQNVLFVVKTACAELLVPATEDFIRRKDIRNRILFMDLPEGLIDMENL